MPMPEKFRANNSESSGFWFWKKPNMQNKHKKNAMNPAKDIISQADDVVNKCMLTGGDDIPSTNKRLNSKFGVAVMFLAITAFAGLLVYVLSTL